MPQRMTEFPSIARGCLGLMLVALTAGCGAPAAAPPEQAALPPTVAPTVVPTLPAPSATPLPPTVAPTVVPTLPAPSATPLPPTVGPTLPAPSATPLPPTDTAPVPAPELAVPPPPSDPALDLQPGDEINAVDPGDTVRSKTGFAFVVPDGWMGISTYGAATGMQEVVLAPEDLGPDDARPHGMLLTAGPLTTLLARNDPIGDVPPIPPPDPATITTPDDLLQAIINLAEDPTVFTNPQPITIDGREGRVVEFTFHEDDQVQAQGKGAMILLDDGGGLRVSVFMPPERWDPAPFDALLASMTFFPPE